jgi:hypothetical protein
VITRFEFRFRFGPDDWRLLDELEPATLLDQWLAESRLTCCSMQGGFFIDIDGQVWSDDSTVDELWMTMAWFRALGALAGGAESYGPTLGPWEESRLTWRRNGARVTMVDIHHSGIVAMAEVTVELGDLGRHVAGVGARFAAFARELKRLVAARLADAAEPLRDRLTLIDEHLPGENPDHGLPIVDRLAAAFAG